MSNSSLVSYTKISPNRTSPRQGTIDTIVIHCIVGQWTAKQGCDYFANAAVGAAPNYVVGKDGSIGLAVEEQDRAWCTGGKDKDGNIIRVNGISGGEYDHRAVSIEVASDTTHPYAVTDKAYAALIELVADICKRNGIKELKWKGDKTLVGQADKQNMIVHRWFANKSCPGDYLYARLGSIAAEVNKRLGVATPEADTDMLYRVRRSWDDAISQIGAFAGLDNAKAMADKNPGYYVFDGKGDVVYPVGDTGTEALTPYLVKVDVTDLRIRSGPGTGYAIKGYTGKGVFTIVEESSGPGSVSGWGKLKSGAGWIALDYAARCN